MESLDEIDKFVEELGIDIITPGEFIRERRRLEQLFMEAYRLAPAMINPMIKCGELHDGHLVQEWAELMVLEPYLFPREVRRPPPEMKPEESQQGRESGPFRFWRFMSHLSDRLYWRPWTRLRRSCFPKRRASFGNITQG